MNAKIKKVIREIEQAQQKLVEIQEKLTLLNNEKTELENLEIIGMFRTANVTTYNIAEVMESFQSFQTQKNTKNPLHITNMEENLNEQN